jgi:hypothetical protein
VALVVIAFDFELFDEHRTHTSNPARYPQHLFWATAGSDHSHTPPCKTGGLQESKLHYFNHLQGFRCQFIRLSIRAQTGEKPFKTKAYTSGQSPPLLVC